MRVVKITAIYTSSSPYVESEVTWHCLQRVSLELIIAQRVFLTCAFQTGHRACRVKERQVIYDVSHRADSEVDSTPLKCERVQKVTRVFTCNMPQVYIILVKGKVKDGQGALFEKCFAPLAQHVAANETGCLSYKLSWDEANPDSFIIFERYVSKDYLEEVHCECKAIQAPRMEECNFEGLPFLKPYSYLSTARAYMQLLLHLGRIHCAHLDTYGSKYVPTSRA